MSKKIILAALGAVVAMGMSAEAISADTASSTTTTTTTNAAPAAKKVHMMKGMEKCYGIAKAGKNDCGSSTEACAGQSKMDSAKNAWLAIPKGTCDKIVGSSTTEGSV